MLRLSEVLVVVGLFLSEGVYCGGGRLLNPPGRGSLFRVGIPSHEDYDDHRLNCGGVARQWNTWGGRCGVCGDDFGESLPRPHELGGKYGEGIITRNYTENQEIEVTVELIGSLLGSFTVSLCPRTYNLEDCFQDLELVDQPDLYHYFPASEDGQRRISLRYKLPAGFVCEHCVLRWRYLTASSWGLSHDGVDCLGCGPQEEFRACADVSIQPPTTETLDASVVRSRPKSGFFFSADKEMPVYSVTRTKPVESFDVRRLAENMVRPVQSEQQGYPKPDLLKPLSFEASSISTTRTSSFFSEYTMSSIRETTTTTSTTTSTTTTPVTTTTSTSSPLTSSTTTSTTSTPTIPMKSSKRPTTNKQTINDVRDSFPLNLFHIKVPKVVATMFNDDLMFSDIKDARKSELMQDNPNSNEKPPVSKSVKEDYFHKSTNKKFQEDYPKKPVEVHVDEVIDNKVDDSVEKISTKMVKNITEAENKLLTGEPKMTDDEEKDDLRYVYTSRTVGLGMFLSIPVTFLFFFVGFVLYINKLNQVPAKQDKAEEEAENYYAYPRIVSHGGSAPAIYHSVAYTEPLDSAVEKVVVDCTTTDFTINDYSMPDLVSTAIMPSKTPAENSHNLTTMSTDEIVESPTVVERPSGSGRFIRNTDKRRSRISRRWASEDLEDNTFFTLLAQRLTRDQSRPEVTEL